MRSGEALSSRFVIMLSISCALAILPTLMQASKVDKTSCLSSEMPPRYRPFFLVVSGSLGVSTIRSAGLSDRLIGTLGAKGFPIR